nr:MAG TPA: hypothetical protein [Caudoviricetes sp.]
MLALCGLIFFTLKDLKYILYIKTITKTKGFEKLKFFVFLIKKVLTIKNNSDIRLLSTMI